ncbi:MAG: LysR family transcriptional regulator [Burkholderiales bacterium]|jgi:DNA-binding transcriptional LysR family regulator|nr:MAG: LysR family transcriptional regulator [Burkholderiales bacterium]
MSKPHIDPVTGPVMGLNGSGDRLQLLETFVRIVEAGSLSAAAAQMHATQPTISRRLQALERALGVRLLQRTTHVMRLTTDGERCFERAKDLLANWASFEADAKGAQEEPQGMLRVVVPHAFGQEKFVKPLAAFMHEHAGIRVEWLLRDDVRDFIAAGIDCGLVVGEPTDPAVVAIKLSEVPRIVVAAPEVAALVSSSDEVEALASLPWLALQTYYRNELVLTHTQTGERHTIAIQPRFATDSLYAMRSAALAGLGVCVASSWLLSEDLAQGRLVHLAPSWRAAPLPVYIAYPYARFYPSRLKRFVETMRQAMPTVIDGLVSS